MHPRQKFSLAVALLAPILLIIFVAASIYIPQLITRPDENFLYFIGDDYTCSDQYAVENGKVVKKGTSTSSTIPESCYVRNSYPEYDNIGRIGRSQLNSGEHCLSESDLSGYECFINGPANKVKKVELSTLDIDYFCLPSQNLTPEQMTEAREAYSKGTDPFSYGTSSPYCKNTDFYIHSTKTNESVKLTFEQAQQYNLNTSTKSPEGYEVVKGGGTYAGFPFGGYSDNYKYYFLKGKNISKRLNVNYKDAGFKVDYFNFLGWVE